MSTAVSYDKYEKMVKRQKRKRIFTISLIVIALLLLSICIMYFVSDVNAVNLVYVESGVVNPSYKDGFERLLSNAGSDSPTGVPSYDDSGLIFGDTINVTPGSGNFDVLPSTMHTYTKTVSYINKCADSLFYGKDNMAYDNAKLLYNPYFLDDCTVYRPSGLIKYLDRYVLCATGTWIAYLAGYEYGERGTALYRVELDTGITYDICVVDYKGAGAEKYTYPIQPGYNSNGKRLTVCHLSSATEACFTEFYVLGDDVTLDSNYYPIRANEGMANVGIDYEHTMKFSDTEVRITNTQDGRPNGSFNETAEYRGNVISFTPIEDPTAIALIEESIKLYDENIKGTGKVYDAGGVVCTH